MATLQDIRRRIRSVQSTQKITRAMKLVAAAKFRRAQERLIEARDAFGSGDVPEGLDLAALVDALDERLAALDADPTASVIPPALLRRSR